MYICDDGDTIGIGSTGAYSTCTSGDNSPTCSDTFLGWGDTCYIIIAILILCSACIVSGQYYIKNKKKH